MPHYQLLAELKQLQLHPIVMTWLHWTTTLLNNYTSMILLIYIHLSEGTRLCLYDILLYKDIVTNCDVLDLQNDIDKIQLWSVENVMKFNETKCKCMVISKKRRAKEPYPTLILGGQSLELVNSYKYLGVTVTSDLSWSLHIQQASVKARKVIAEMFQSM